MERQQEFVLRTIEERDIRFVRLWFTDVLGFLKSVAVAPAELEGAFAEGIGFDGSAIEGFARVAESDMLARPDPTTFQVLPWRGDAPGTARMFCDILTPDGAPSYADPRHVLRRVMQKAIDLRYADALTTADNLMTMRLVVKEVALEQGVYASFMPKPFSDQPGSAMHTHLSLFEGDRNAFHDASDQFQLSKVGKAFVAGLLTHAAEFTAVTDQWVNSYKRLWGGGEAPAYICWGRNNRSALVRVPMYKPQKGNSTRVEIRSPDAACNPYLTYAVLLAAGLKGIEEG